MNALGVCRSCCTSPYSSHWQAAGAFMAKIYQGERTFLAPMLGRSEHGIYRLAGIDQQFVESNWKRYALAVLLDQLHRLRRRVSAAAAARRAAAEPAGLRRRSSPDSAFNTAVSFATQHQLARLWR